MPKCCEPRNKPAPLPQAMPCPANGTRSSRVDLLIVMSLVRKLPLRMPPAQYYFCEARGCDVVYFPSNPAAPVFRSSDLLVAVWSKEQKDTVPVCYCFGFTPKEIREEFEQTGKSAVSESIRAELKAGNCACQVKNPSGTCCLGNVTRIIRDARARRGQK